MTRCTPCTLCETDHKLTAVLGLLRSTRLGLLTMSSTRALSLRGLQSCVAKKHLRERIRVPRISEDAGNVPKNLNKLPRDKEIRMTKDDKQKGRR
jgi:hypothetical protein